jgi:RES domain-containing protein
MLYTSMTISLAMLEILVHADESEVPPQMYVTQIEIIGDDAVYQFPDKDLPKSWREPDNLRLKVLGDRLMAEKKYICFQVRSAVLPSEWNILLNPLFPGYADLVKVRKIDALATDLRLR